MKDALRPAYYFPTDAFRSPRSTPARRWSYAGGYKRSNITLTVDSKGDIVQTRTEENVPIDKDNADRAVFVKMEGWDVPLELRVVAQVSPSDASCVVAGVGTLRDVEDRVLTPSIRAITRDVAGGTYEVTEAKVDENGKPILDRDGKPNFITINRPTQVLDLINQRPPVSGSSVASVRRRKSPASLFVRCAWASRRFRRSCWSPFVASSLQRNLRALSSRSEPPRKSASIPRRPRPLPISSPSWSNRRSTCSARSRTPKPLAMRAKRRDKLSAASEGSRSRSASRPRVDREAAPPD